MISGNMVGSYSQIGKTLIIEDENGAQLTGVITENTVVFDATPNDVREGKTYAGDDGIQVGEKVIPSYHTFHGTKAIAAGGQFTIRLSTLDAYDYTVFHGMICQWNTSLSNSVATDRVIVLDKVYPAQSTEAISSVTKDDNTKSVVLGITNNTNSRFVIRYMTYKEIE
jgi:hypothetical protein